MNSPKLKLFGGNANKNLTDKIAIHLDCAVTKCFVGQYADGETRVEILENIRGCDVFIVQSLSAPTNHHIMESLILIDAAKRASARTITLVAPYFGYARQERKIMSRTPITAKLVADLFAAAGIDRVLALELHNSAIQGFFSVPVDHLFAKPIFIEHLKSTIEDSTIVISPDAGGVERARALAKQFNCDLAVIDKRRDRPNESAVVRIVGHVQNKDCIIIDDIIDTGGSVAKAAEALKQAGASQVRAAITHPVLSGNAVEQILKSPLSQLMVTDSIPLSKDALNCPKIIQVSIAELIAQAIKSEFLKRIQ